MRCKHTGKAFVVRKDLRPNPAILVPQSQLGQVKAALIDTRAQFAIDYSGVYFDGGRFFAICFRPDVDEKALETALAKA
ncbi:MAG: hypothetical protein ACO1RT_06335 [Planctomycetaceae bacterium]